MVLPNGYLDELKSRLSLSSLVGRKVSWDARKSNPGKGDYWAPCPFHQEKTASFHVDDRKGYYYCFGCHQKGDAVNFIRETENLGFMEAVELLASEAGMPMPKQDPRAAAKAEAAAGLADIMEMAVTFYRRGLRGGRAGAARDYLARRGLDEQVIEQFEIGFAADIRDGLLSHLKGKGVVAEEMEKAGLVIRSDDASTYFDRFRGRIMFPIRDGRGRAIAFGGRAMSPEARAKYLNSPETPLFHKGHALYNLGPARTAARTSETLIVAEGYMDVIALASHGFEHAVAPLGTAITEDQLRLCWRIANEPVVALDGDKAGLRAAMRLVDIALPMLEAGKSLRFALMPDGQDPDDLLRSAGPSAFRAHVDDAISLFDLFWRKETEGQVFDSPERRAALDQRLRAAIAKIEDAGVRSHYEAAIRERRRALFSSPKKIQTRQPWSPTRGGVAGPSGDTRMSALAKPDKDNGAAERLREATILALMLSYPDMLSHYEQELETLPFGDRHYDQLRHTCLQGIAAGLRTRSEFESFVRDNLGAETINSLYALGHVRANPYIREDASVETIQTVLAEAIALHRTARGRVAEAKEAEAALDSSDGEGLTWRLAEAMNAAEAARASDADEGDKEHADAREMSEYLQSLIDEKSWIKKAR